MCGHHGVWGDEGGGGREDMVIMACYDTELVNMMAAAKWQNSVCEAPMHEAQTKEKRKGPSQPMSE